jgi:hypothetical protein
LTDQDLARRVDRLEIIEAVRSTFHEYTHYLDGGFVDDLLGVFAADAEMTAANYPPGSGHDVVLQGHEGIRSIYDALTFGAFRHHATNATVSVADDHQSAELSSYFITASPYAFGGGLYQGTFVPVDGLWRIRTWRVASTWGWRISGQDAPPYLQEVLGSHALREGKPVVFRP